MGLATGDSIGGVLSVAAAWVSVWHTRNRLVQAEEQLRQQAQKISNKPALLVVAGIIGSALGSFVMHWAFLRRLLGARPFLHFDKLAHPAPR
jgi:H+/Cl- antiporter ClcA